MPFARFHAPTLCHAMLANPPAHEHSYPINLSSSMSYPRHPSTSRVFIHFRPHLLDPLPLGPRFLAICGLSLQPLATKTLVDLSLLLIAAADAPVKEASGVAFVEGVHNLFAPYCGVPLVCLLIAYLVALESSRVVPLCGYDGLAVAGRTGVALCVKMRMHYVEIAGLV